MNSHYLQGIEDKLEQQRVEIELERYKKLVEKWEPVKDIKELNKQVNKIMGATDVENMHALPSQSKEFLKWAYPKVKQDRKEIRKELGITSIDVDKIPQIVKAVINTHHYETKDKRLLNIIRKRYLEEYKNR